ncbi:uncharacterized protein LOC130713258 [Lotus japonicus]|uniref:uncharacterized protein LOC130713258 n=1 Tax=Lotus japonicus TaxID=34305 RepID=UPI002588BD25|nr:uncharacterized protein LOC130713258 [Lotus japonicus]
MVFMNIVSWNIRGAAARGVSLMLRDLVHRHSVSCLAVLEPRISGPRALSIIRSLEFQGVHVEDAIGFSGGIWILWDTSILDIHVLRSHRQFVHTKVRIIGTSQAAFVTFVYGSPQASLRAELWEALPSLLPNHDAPWMVLGDFNAYLEASDKAGGGALNLPSMQRFQSCLTACGLFDMGFKGPPFTWEGRGVRERIDRGVCNTLWLHYFPEAVILHLPQLKSDHKPILMASSGIVEQRHFVRPFRFLASWLTHDDFPRVVEESWQRGDDWLHSSNGFREDVLVWNQEVFGNILKRKRRLIRRLEGINQRLSMAIDRGLDTLQRSLWKEYNAVLVQEELLWMQKSRCLWLQFGDRNTSFFHTATLVRRKRNRIEALLNQDGDLITDYNALKELAFVFFRDSYMDEGGGESLTCSTSFSPLPAAFLNHFQAEFDASEIKDAVFSMGPLKAPGPDGFQPIFFHSQWHTVGDSTVDFVMRCFADPSRISQVNETLIVLIPKIDSPERITHYRPISLCNVIYKTITKVITNRLRSAMGDLVSPNQCSFVPGRHSSDNIIIAQEVFHSMRSRKGAKGWMAMKVDLEKAYDRLSWSFLLDTLRLIGLDDHMCSLIMQCVSSCRYQVCFNGDRTDSFIPHRGLRQGDPLSPYLFVLCMERLAHKINDAITDGGWKPVRLSRNGPPISHLFFADDLLLFGEASMEQMETVMTCLGDFCSASGMKVSIAKTRMMISSNVGTHVASQLSHVAGVALTSDLGRYLGVPLVHKRVTATNYQYILDRTQRRLSSWRTHVLNFAGRVTLTKSVIAALPTYCMQTDLLPKVVCNKLEKIQRDFIWGSAEGNRSSHPVAWSKLCRPKQEGGLGLRHMHDFNRSLVMKMGWGLISKPDALWARVLRDKYACGSAPLPVVQKKHNESHIWRAIRKTWEELNLHLRWRVGIGSEVSFWTDRWLLSGVILGDVAMAPIAFPDLHRSVADYFDHSRLQWRVADFQHLIPAHNFAEILAMSPPSDVVGQDRIVWGLTSNGLFSSKSAYEARARSDAGDVSLPWSRVWKWDGPFKVSNFLWRTLNNGIWVNNRRWQSHLTEDALCPLCQEEPETTLHLFRDCCRVRPLWQQHVRPSMQASFFECDFRPWLLNNLQNDSLQPLSSGIFLNFGLLLWSIWSWRSKFVFQGITFDLHHVFTSALRLQLEHSHSVSTVRSSTVAGSRNYTVQQIRWAPPPPQWIKCNTDGSVRGSSGLATSGGVFRDEFGQWKLGFCRNLGSSNVLWAELWGIFSAISLAWRRSFPKVIIESDSSVAVQLVTLGCDPWHPYGGLVGQIRAWMERAWEVRVVHVRREANQVADCLANMAHDLTLGIHVIERAPPNCSSLLLADVSGVSFPRSTRV